MKVKWGDLRALLKYADKENRKDDDECSVIVNNDSLETKLQVLFTDEEDRDCCITISSTAFSRPVRLTKSMDLITRLGGDHE